jgi:mannosyltransferase OCH1-like enzyme
MIPRIIHQTFRDGNLPKEVQSNIQTLKLRNPAWQYHFYDETDRFLFLRKFCEPRILKAYNSINPMYGAARADFFRYILIYHLGGLYLDIKSSTNRNLDTIVANKQYLLSHWDNGPRGTHKNWGLHFPDFPRGEFQQWYIASVPKHPFLKRVIDSVLHNIETYDPVRSGVGQHGVIRTTGPIAYTQAIRPVLHMHQHYLANNNHELGLVYNIYRNSSPLYNSRIPHYTQLTDPIVLT